MPSRFTSHMGLILFERDDGSADMREGRTQWFVNPDLTYDIGAEGSTDTITVPSFNPIGKTHAEIIALLILGMIFITDLGSIPQLAWSLGLSPSGEAAKAFVLHDLCYSRKGRGIGARRLPSGAIVTFDFTRKQADDLLMEAMKVCGVPAWKRALIWSAVRVGGGAGWGR